MNKHMYILADGGRIAASGPSEFVRLLREGSWFDSECTDEAFSFCAWPPYTYCTIHRYKGNNAKHKIPSTLSAQ